MHSRIKKIRANIPTALALKRLSEMCRTLDVLPIVVYLLKTNREIEVLLKCRESILLTLSEDIKAFYIA